MMIDMHTHSSASDGSLSPSALVDEALRKGLYAFALTDHDTVSGLAELERAMLEARYPRAVPGVEISANISGYSVHICGLFIDRSSRELASLLAWIRQKRDERNDAILEKLSKLGYKISCHELSRVAKGESTGRPHFARILVEKAFFRRIQDVFDRLLKKGKPAYADRQLPDASTAIETIKKAGGVSIWAHPFARRDFEKRKFRSILSQLKDAGLDGIEAYYSTYDRSTQDYLLGIASEEKLLVSGGSDFHGDYMVGISMGTGMGSLHVPDELFSSLSDRSPRFKI